MSDQYFGNLFEGQDLSEEFKEKAKLVFEAAVTEKTNEKLDEMVKELEQNFDTELEKIHEELVKKIDDSLNYFVEGWMEDNKLAIETGIRNDIVESFISKLKDLFVESYIDVPEEKVDYVAEMEDKVVKMEDKLNEQIEKNIELSSKISSMVKESIFADVVKNLAESDVEKLKGMSSSVEFISESDYKQKLETLKENFFKKSESSAPVDTTTQIVEGVEGGEINEIDKAAEYISKKYANI